MAKQPIDEQLEEANTILDGIRTLLSGYCIDKAIIIERIEAYFKKYMIKKARSGMKRIGDKVRLNVGKYRGKTGVIISKSIYGYYYEIEFDDVKTKKDKAVCKVYSAMSFDIVESEGE